MRSQEPSHLKERTIVMVLALTVSTSLITPMSSTLGSARLSDVGITDEVPGYWDLSVQHTETNPEPFLIMAETSRRSSLWEQGRTHGRRCARQERSGCAVSG